MNAPIWGENKILVDRKPHMKAVSTKKMAQRLDFIWRAAKMRGNIFFEDYSVLDFGCGGFDAIDPLKRIARIYYGVDRDPARLLELEQAFANSEDITFTSVHLVDSKPSIEDFAISDIDLFICTDTSRPMFEKQEASGLLHSLYSICRQHSVGLFQIRYGRHARAVDAVANGDDEPPIFRIEEFWEIAEKAGFETICVRDLNRSTKEATFYLRRRT